MKKLSVVLVGLALLILSGCSGTNVYVTGDNNTISAEQLREGGATIDTKPNTQWGNIGK